MSRFVLEALFIGAKEGLKLALCLFLVLGYLRTSGSDSLKRPFAAGLAIVFLASFAAMSVPVSLELREAIVRLLGYVFGLFYFFSLGALFHATGTDVLGPLAGVVRSSTLLVPVTLLLTILYFFPDMAGSSLYVADLSGMSGASFGIFGAAGAGFLMVLAAAYGISRRYRPDISRLFDLPQLLLVLSLLKLLAGGVRGFAELSLIPAVQAGLKKLIHDIVHQTFVLLLVPDHAILSTTTWTFVNVLFGEAVGLWLSLLLLVLPLALFIRRHFTAPVSVPDSVVVPARRRIFVKAVQDLRVQRSLPVIVFLLFIIGLWFSQKGTSLNTLYIPDARPVTAEGGMVTIPLQSPLDDLRDGSIHKFSFADADREIRILILKKPDGSLGVCLDACEICAPDGYGQAKGHVVCLYCRTPIPFETVGRAGGCNPIPLQALVTDKDVRIAVAEILEKWSTIGTGKSGGTAAP